MIHALADLLNQELALWHQAGHKLCLWWRDDDAIAATPALKKLLTLHQQFSVPLSLAVIPGRLDASLPKFLIDYKSLAVLQHGITHHNNALPDQKKIELGGSLSSQECQIGLKQGQEILKQHFQDLFVPVLVPPWNRLDPSLVPTIETNNFMALSLFGTKPYPSTLPCINTHLDIINWSTRRFIGYDALLDRLHETAQDLRQQQRWHEPIGLLTHHLVHDNECWDGLEIFLAECCQFLDVHFLSPLQILDIKAQHM